MDKLKMHSPDLSQDNIAKIRDLFPACVTEARDEATGAVRLAVDFDQLRQELSDHIVDGPQERYRLDWPGKREALIVANAPVALTLRPDALESKEFDSTQNLFIEGDNLDALKLIQDTYLGRVKLIYIDPPYNTGRDFVYDDNFAQGSEEYLAQSLQRDSEGNRLIANTSSNGRFHSDWMSMMFARLRLARNILADDGVIFISIDDGEQANLKKLCDEIFGEGNFIANAIWRSKDNSNNDAKKFSTDHNHTLVYAKNANWEPAKLNDEAKRGHFKNPDNDPRGAYFDGNPLNSPAYRENLVFDLVSPTGAMIKPPKNGWRWSKETIQEKIDSGEIRFSEDGKSIRRRTYLADMAGLPPSTLWIDLDKTGHNRQAKYELVKLIPEDVFETPKPVKLINFILQLCNLKSGDLVLDFFAGAATTAEAVMRFSAETGTDLKFAMIQIAEPAIEESAAKKAGYATIAEIAKERIRRAGTQVLEGECHPDWNRDVGFRVLKVDTSNMKDVYYRPDELKQTDLLDMVDNVKEGRTAEDLLFQVLVDWGVDLTLPIRRETVQGKTVFFVDDNALVACFDRGVTEDLVKELAGHEPLRVVFRDNGFVSDAVKINVEQIFRQLSPTTDVKSI
jgi:adenine-specific DNA-methyltransferase